MRSSLQLAVWRQELAELPQTLRIVFQAAELRPESDEAFAQTLGANHESLRLSKERYSRGCETT